MACRVKPVCEQPLKNELGQSFFSTASASWVWNCCCCCNKLFFIAADVVAVADVVAADDGVAFQDLVHDLELGEVLHPPADSTMLQKS